MTGQARETTPRRLKILGADEIEALYGRPAFTPDERVQYFTVSQPASEGLQEFRSVKSQAYFLLQLGYFKAKHVFFTFDLFEAQDDLAYLLEQYFPRATLEDRDPLNKRTRLKQQRLILTLSNYRSCDAHARQQLAAKARQVAMVSGKPVYIFRELLHYLEEHRLVAPGYSVLQDMVGKALTQEQHRWTTILRAHLTRADMEALQDLLEDAPGLYAITQLKREPKDFSASAMRHEMHCGDQLRALYGRAQQVLPAL
jgi:Domain of unknown function (DUF4158)